MVSPWLVLGLAYMATLSSSFSVHTDCIAMRRYEAKLHGTNAHVLHGTNAHINAWILDKSDILLLTLGYGKGHPYFYDYIKVKPKMLTMKRVRVNEETIYEHINLTQPLETGWVDINFNAEEQYRFNFTSQNVYHELPGESKMRLTKFTMEGSNITVNCKFDTIYWKIVKDITYIPLKLNTTNSFSLSSRRDFLPTLTIGNSSIELGITDNAINNIQRIKDEYQSPLPKFKEHIVKINCVAYQHCTCTYILGIDEDQKIQKRILKSVTSLSIHGDGTEFFVKLNRLKPKEVFQNYLIYPLPPAESNEAIMIFLIVLSSLLVMAPIVLGYLIYQYHINNKQHEKQHESQHEEKKRLMKQPKTQSGENVNEEQLEKMTTLIGQSSNWKDIHEEQHEKQFEKMKQLIAQSPNWQNVVIQTRLWDAVVNNNQPLVEHLLESGKDPDSKDDGFDTSPLQEAHLRGHKGIVKMFAKKIHNKQSVPTKDQIELTLKELEKRTGQVFQAAMCGLYDRGNGVNALLNTYSLPGTIKDSKGWSLVHHMAEFKYSDDRPVWNPADIKNFFEHHVFYINAIDHWGNTPLHFLAQHQGIKDKEHQGSKDVKGGEHTVSAEEAWLKIAELFIRYDCDPRIPNHKNKLPHEIAIENKNLKLANYLKQKFDDLAEIPHASAANRFGELVEAARNNNFYKIIRLLKKHVPMLPISADRDPLVEAIRNGHQKVVFLLICAGTPLCNGSIDDLTPLEAAHNTLGLPALFPALMRKVYSDRLMAERDQLDDIQHQALSKGIECMRTSILEMGDKSKWNFESKANEESSDLRSSEARKLLVAASGLGLSLTVQLLGLENLELRPLPNEESPVDKAQDGDYLDTLYSLCRDLKMSPYATHKKSEILDRLETDLLIAECNILKTCADDDKLQLLLGLDECKIQIFLEHASTSSKDGLNWSLYNSDMFYIIARYGLIYLLHKYVQNNDKSVLDRVVEEFSSSTMMHISVLYGQQHITEYLLFHGAAPEKKTVGEFTSAHIAAMVGHKGSMKYIISYMENKDIDTEGMCNIEMKAKELINYYEVMRKRSNYPFLDSSDAGKVKNEIGESDKALEILKRKTKVMHISTKAEMKKKVEEILCKYKDKDNPQAEDIAKETKAFFKDIDVDLFKGKLIEYGHYCEGNSLFNNDIVEFTLESETYNSKNVQIDLLSVEDGLVIVKSKKDSKNSIFQDNNFMKSFIKASKERIRNYKPLNEKNISLSPPFLIPYAFGVELYWACNYENKLYRVKSYVDLVIKADLPEGGGIQNLPENIQNSCTDKYAELHVTNLKGDWTYRGYSLETKIFGNLNDNQRMVWLLCRFIKLISKPYWWVPTSNIRKIANRLDVNYVGVAFPQERTLKILFLRELAEYPYKWEERDIFDRVIGIYRRCLTTDNKGNQHPVESVKSYLMPTSYRNIMPESVCGVIKYLDGLK